VESEVETEVVAERGLWAVYLMVLTERGVDRRLVETYVNREHALAAAEVIARAAARRRSTPEDDED
jgi:hypothetical protein